MADKVCVICGAVFRPWNNNQICCSKECSEENHRLRNKKSNVSWKQERQEKTQKANEALALVHHSVCDKFCDGCAFEGKLQFDLRVCNYLLCTGKRRPCPAGTGCTVKETGRRRKGWHEEEANSRKNHRIRIPAQEKRERKREREQERREKARKDREFTMKCGVCGKLFKTTDTRRRNCSPECSTRARTRSTNNYRKRRKMEGFNDQ